MPVGQISAPTQRFLAVGLLCALTIAAWSTFIRPTIDKSFERQELMEHATELLDRYRSLWAQRPALEKLAGELKTRTDVSEAFVPNANPNVAAAAIRAKIRTLFGAQGVTIKAVQELPPQIEAGLICLTVRVSGEGSIQGVERVLTAISASKPLLFVSGTTIHAIEGGSISGQKDTLLTAQFEVQAFMSDKDK